MLNTIRITTNQYIQTNLCLHVSYLEDQRNLKIYNKKEILKKERPITPSYCFLADGRQTVVTELLTLVLLLLAVTHLVAPDLGRGKDDKGN